jgi:hypothetical protein
VSGVTISARILIFFLVLLLLAPPADAKNKKKQTLPDYVLKALKVLIVIHPDSGEPLTNLAANRTALDNVERAMMKWGRFNLVMDVQTADLVVVVRAGYAGGPAVSNSPTDNRPLIYQPSGGDVRVAGQQGRPPDLNDPGLAGSADRGPHIGNEIGPSEDTFEVYQGGIEYPLDAAPAWRYMAKDALSGPQVTAVEQFRKAIDESEKQHQRKP